MINPVPHRVWQSWFIRLRQNNLQLAAGSFILAENF
jgi:hypothetical protein